MDIHEVGKENEKVMVLIPVTMMCWKQFSEIIPLLADEYHVIAVSTDGFDGDKNTTFTTAEDSAHKLAEYVKKNIGDEIELVFGESFGSATALMMFHAQEIHINSLIMNGPQYFDFGILTKPIMNIIPKNQYRYLGKMSKAKSRGKIPLMMKLFTRTSDENMLGMLAKMPDNISLKTLSNCTNEAAKLYKELEGFNVKEDAKVSVWHGEKEPNMKKAIDAIRRIYPNMEDHPFEGMGHGEIIAYPEQMAAEIKMFINTK